MGPRGPQPKGSAKMYACFAEHMAVHLGMGMHARISVCMAVCMVICMAVCMVLGMALCVNLCMAVCMNLNMAESVAVCIEFKSEQSENRDISNFTWICLYVRITYFTYCFT